MQLAKLRALQRFCLAGNNLYGQIPSEIGDLSQSIELRLDRNQLNGSIPLNLRNLHSLDIILDLSQNFLLGKIPSSLGKLQFPTAMNLSHNNLITQGVSI